MRYMDRLARALAFALLFVAWTNGGAEEFAVPTDDGWHAWRIQGESDLVRIYVRINDGSPTRIRFRGKACMMDEPTDFQDLGVIDNEFSIAWLVEKVGADSRVSEDAIAAISAHAGDAAFTALTGLLEDRGRGKKTREQALFWLAQTNSDRAFAYLDALISRN